MIGIYIRLRRRGGNGYGYVRETSPLFGFPLLCNSNKGVLEGLCPMIRRYIHIIIIFPFPLSSLLRRLALCEGKGISPSPFQEGLTGEG